MVRMTKLPTSATREFVDRLKEMGRIRNALKIAKNGNGQLLVIRGEAGSGKTRLMQEAATEAEKRGFYVGLGTSLAESVTPYHPWKDVLERLGLDAILEEVPPPKLLGILCYTSEGKVRAKVVRKGEDSELLHQDDSILKSVHDLVSKRRRNEEETVISSHDRFRLVIRYRPTFYLAAILEGREDEIFLADMKELTKTVESLLAKKKGKVDNAVRTCLCKFLESEKFEGIDYTKDDPKLHQTRFFELATLGLSRKANTRPLCIVFDDLHWADPSSLDLLLYVSRNTRNSGILILCSYRIEEAGARPYLRKALEVMQQEELLEEMDLKGLFRKDMPNLAKSFIGAHNLQDDFLDLLWRETQGNPLFVREVLKGLEEEGAIAVRGAVKRLIRSMVELAIPERVREVVLARLRRLPEADRRLLDAASTCGTRFTAALVSKVAGEEEVKVLNGLKAIVKIYGLLHPVDSGFTFEHSAVQEVLYDGIPKDKRQSYHREAAEWLELAGGPLEDVAEHYYRANDYRAVPKLSEAAEKALCRNANVEAARLFGEAVTLARMEERGHLLLKQADALDLGARFDEALTTLEKAEKEDRPRDCYFRKRAVILNKTCKYDEAMDICQKGLANATDEERERLQLVQALIHWHKGAYSSAIGLVNKVLDNFGDSKRPDDYVKALNILALCYSEQGHYDKAIDINKKILAYYEATGNLRGQSEALNNIGASLRDKDKALRFYERSLAISVSIGDQFGIARTLDNIGGKIRKKDPKRALECHTQSLAIAQTIGTRNFESNILDNISRIHIEQGDFEQGIEFLERSLSIGRMIGARHREGISLNNIGWLYFELCSYDKALKFLLESLETSETIGDIPGIVIALDNIGVLNLEIGKKSRAKEFLQRAMETARNLKETSLIAASEAHLASALLQMGQMEEAIKTAHDALNHALEAKSKEAEGHALTALALCSAAKGKGGEAREMLLKALEIFEREQFGLETGQICLELGRLEFRLNNRQKGSKHFRKAIQIFKSKNLKERASKARKNLEELNAEFRSKKKKD